MSGKKLPDLTGQTFGRWTVIKAVPRDKSDPNDRQRYLCRCECGTERTIEASSEV